MSLIAHKSISKGNQYKEKVVEIYENFFYGADISKGNDKFWDEFFLLKANIMVLKQMFDTHSFEQIMCLKIQLNKMFIKCVESMYDCHWVRMSNAAQTAICLVNGVFSSTTVIGQTQILVDVLIGRENVDKVIQDLVIVCHSNLISVTPVRIKSIIINLLLSLVSAGNLLNENAFIDYMLTDEMLEGLVMIISDYSYRNVLGNEAFFLLTVLMQYNRHKTNYLRMKMSILEEPIVLNGISHIISLMFAEYIKNHSDSNNKSKGLFSSFTSVIGNFLMKSPETCNIQMIESCYLLMLFDFLQINVHFSYIIASSHPVIKPANITNNIDSIYQIQSDSSLQKSNDNSYIEISSTLQEDPTNILVVFLEYCSIVMQDIKENSSYNNCRLCFLILLSLAEDQNTTNTLHDVHMNLKVNVHRKQMRHRKILQDEENNFTRPLVCAALDVLVEFMTCHIMKALPADLFHISLNVIHRFVCFQKNKKIRIKYDWNTLWTTLVTLTRYLVNNFEELPQKCNVFGLLNKVVVIFNLFITFGDAFMYSPIVYDDLYYEIIRMSTVFENLYNFGLRSSVSKSDFKDDISALLDHLINIRAIINHFNPKIQLWCDEHHLSSLSREQILDIVSLNYDTLTLKLHSNLDRYDQYSESNSKEKAFFTNLTRSVVTEIRERCFKKSLELQSNLRDVLLNYMNNEANSNNN